MNHLSFIQSANQSANSPTCKTCTHFKQHYILTEYDGFAIPCGHCVRARFKHTRPEHQACVHYAVRTEPLSLPDRTAAIRFLTTDVLDRILEMRLPPEVHDPFQTK